jgi:hypothetical protein
MTGMREHVPAFRRAWRRYRRARQVFIIGAAVAPVIAVLAATTPA